MQFLNRTHAGKLLAHKFADIPLDKKNTIVIALPRGGVPVAHEIAKALQLPLDIILVKKIGAPSYPELAIGSVSEEDEEFYNNDLIVELGYKHSDIDPIKERALIKLQEIAIALRQGHAPMPLSNKNIIVVDDGIATGATMESVIKVLKKRNVKKIIIATPVASAEALLNLEKIVDQVVVIMTPNPIYSVGEWYEDFIQIETEEVIKILSEYYLGKNKKYSKSHQDFNRSDIT
ncbi:MAG: phosphoribosyltransferase family protein [Bacteriovorax sp.]|nr:phosphoribosyltransferase family protein [Bacteriovorax sp.]